MQLGEQIGACAVSDPSADVDMVTHFYIVAASGLIESWLTGELGKSPEEIITSGKTNAIIMPENRAMPGKEKEMILRQFSVLFKSEYKDLSLCSFRTTAS